MATDTVYEPIRLYLEQNWATTPLVFPNETDISASVGSSHWVYAEVVGDTIEQKTIGTGDPARDRWDQEGILSLTIMCPEGAGTVEASRLARMLVDMFRGTRLENDSIEFGSASVGRWAGKSDEGRWFMFPVEIEWRHIGT